MKTIKELMEWRFACKHFDMNKQIPEDVLMDLVDTARLAPSSFGLQAWKFIVVTNQELKAKLAVAAYNQPQITEASALVFFCARTDVLGADGVLAKYESLYKTEHNKTDEEVAGFAKMIEGTWNMKGPEGAVTWVQKQVYIPAEALILAAAEKGIDSCPMEGFDPAGVSAALGLPANILPTVLVTLGYRNMEQPKKVRFPLSEVLDLRK